MSMLTGHVEHVIGVDTHRDTNTAAVKRLIARGKERGYITFDELNAVLPPVPTMTVAGTRLRLLASAVTAPLMVMVPPVPTWRSSMDAPASVVPASTVMDDAVPDGVPLVRRMLVPGRPASPA